MSGTEKPRVAVLVPARDQVDVLFASDYGHLLAMTALQAITQYTKVMTGASLSRQREALADYALSTDATHLMWLDSDMRFPPDTIKRLLEHRLPAVCAGYVSRTVPSVPLVWAGYPESDDRVVTSEKSTGLQEINAAGFGCVMFERQVFEQMKKPRFLMPYAEGLEGDYLQEDLYFCLKLKSMGVKLWLDHDLTKQVAHVGRIEFRP